MISVIVPVYKVEPYLNQCVESILCQTYADLEILLVDDGSPDRCGQICDEYEKQDCRVRVFHTQNHGLSAARNVGLQNAEGEYIGFVDSDDWIEPKMYETLLRGLEETESNVCICDFCQEPIAYEKEFQSDDRVYQDADAIKALLDRKINYNVWNKLYRREVFQDITFPEGKNFEDIAIMHRIMYEAGRVAVIPNLGYHYRIRLESITRNYSARNLIDHADAYLNSYVYLSGLQKQSFPINQHDLLSLPARGISIVWRWWYQCSIEEKAEYEDRIGELLDFTREYLPLFGFSSWPNYLRLSSLFMHSDSGVSFAVLYTFNQLFRRLWPRKGNVVRE